MSARVVATTGFVATCNDPACDGWVSPIELDPADAEWHADNHEQQEHDQ